MGSCFCIALSHASVENLDEYQWIPWCPEDPLKKYQYPNKVRHKSRGKGSRILLTKETYRWLVVGPRHGGSVAEQGSEKENNVL